MHIIPLASCDGILHIVLASKFHLLQPCQFMIFIVLACSLYTAKLLNLAVDNNRLCAMCPLEYNFMLIHKTRDAY